LKKNKKAQVEMLYQIAPLVLLLAVVFLVILPFIQGYSVNTEISSEQLTYDVRSARMFNARECLAYEENTQVHPAIIDINKLTQTRVETCLEDDYGTKDYYLLFDILNENTGKFEKHTYMEEAKYLEIKNKEDSDYIDSVFLVKYVDADDPTIEGIGSVLLGLKAIWKDDE
jgi:hypothetical protein